MAFAGFGEFDQHQPVLCNHIDDNHHHIVVMVLLLFIELFFFQLVIQLELIGFKLLLIG